MKSLEIVNEEIEMRKGNILNDAEWNRLKKLEKIKQDLEVLEIIKEKKVDIRELSVWIGTNLEIERALVFYNDSRSFDCRLTIGELLKIKQWLEENE